MKMIENRLLLVMAVSVVIVFAGCEKKWDTSNW